MKPLVKDYMYIKRVLHSVRSRGWNSSFFLTNVKNCYLLHKNIPHPCFKNPGLVPIQSTVNFNIIIILLHKNIPHPFKNLGSAPI